MDKYTDALIEREREKNRSTIKWLKEDNLALFKRDVSKSNNQLFSTIARKKENKSGRKKERGARGAQWPFNGTFRVLPARPR